MLSSVDLAYNKVTDASMKEVGLIVTLNRLKLNNSTVTDTGLKELASLKELVF